MLCVRLEILDVVRGFEIVRVYILQHITWRTAAPDWARLCLYNNRCQIMTRLKATNEKKKRKKKNGKMKMRLCSCALLNCLNNIICGMRYSCTSQGDFTRYSLYNHFCVRCCCCRRFCFFFFSFLNSFSSRSGK